MNNSVEVFFPNLSKPILCDMEDISKIVSIRTTISKVGCGKAETLRVFYNLIPNTPISHVILYGKKKDGVLIDHKDRDAFNHHRNNMRKCSYSQNLCNRSKYEKNGTSIYLGVCFVKKKNYWMFTVQKNRKKFQKGGFKTELEAAKARDKKAKELHGEFAVLNFQEDNNS